MLKINMMMLLLLMMGIVLLGSGVAEGFKETQDGARILSRDDELNKISDSSYSIPFRKGNKGVGGERVGGGSARFVEVQRNGGEVDGRRRLDGGVPLGFDNAEFSLLTQMKTMEIPPSEDAVNYYSEKYASSPTTSRFAILSSRRVRRSPADLKFDNDKSGASSGGMMGQQGTSGSSSNIPSSSVSFDGQKGGNNGPPNPSGKEPTEENKRLFPELFGLGGPGYPHYGGYPGGHFGGGGYPGGHYGSGGYPVYPGGHFGGGGYPGGHYGSGGYPVYPGGYPGGHYGSGGYPGGLGGASASASASAGGHGLHNRPVNGLYGGGVTPILGVGGGYPGHYGPGFIGGGFFRGEDGGKGGSKDAGSSDKVSGSGGSKSTGGVNFE